MLPGLVTFIGGTEEEAQRRKTRLDGLLDLDLQDAVNDLAQRMNVPAEKLSLDSPIPAELLPDPDPDTVPFSVGHHRTIETLVHEGCTVREIIASVQGVGIISPSRFTTTPTKGSPPPIQFAN